MCLCFCGVETPWEVDLCDLEGGSARLVRTHLRLARPRRPASSVCSSCRSPDDSTSTRTDAHSPPAAVSASISGALLLGPLLLLHAMMCVDVRMGPARLPAAIDRGASGVDRSIDSIDRFVAVRLWVGRARDGLKVVNRCDRTKQRWRAGRVSVLMTIDDGGCQVRFDIDDRWASGYKLKIVPMWTESRAIICFPIDRRWT